MGCARTCDSHGDQMHMRNKTVVPRPLRQLAASPAKYLQIAQCMNLLPVGW